LSPKRKPGRSAASPPPDAGRSKLIAAALGALCALGLWASAAGAQPAPALSAPPAIVGCYALTIQQWPKNIVFKTPPRRIELKAAPAQGLPGKAAGFQVAPTSDGTSTYPRYASWIPEASGALITWTNGFSGLRMRLTTTRAGIQGIAEAFWNLQLESSDGQARTGRLTAQRVACG
jgi:hypothetical protein